MKRYNILILITVAVLFFLGTTSCVQDLDRRPTNDDIAQNVYESAEGTMQALAKVYGAWSLTEGDVIGIDDGMSGFTRAFWNLQELPTDEAKCAWNDVAIYGLNEIDWNASTGYIQGLYYRSIIQIKYANEFLNNIEASPVDAAEKELMKAEVRFIRAYQYWVLMDLFGNPPFITEENTTGVESPKQIQRANLFAYVEKELLDIEGKLKPAKQHVYGRADATAAQALLSRLYLNAEVYTGTPRYADAAKYAEKVIQSGYGLADTYKYLFYADNHKMSDELILTAVYDGENAQSWSGATFFVSASFNEAIAEQVPGGIGTTGMWGGNRMTPTFGELFEEGDKRALILKTTDHMENLRNFGHGVHTYKYVNLNQDGTPGKHLQHCDMDFPLFRAAEAFLIYAEASVRDASVDKAKGLQYYNAIRTRAGVPTKTTITLQDIIDERGRELYWEGHRRTDLIRFGLFTSGDYLWEWKGGVPEGRAVSSHYALYPIPASDALANIENLKQNPNY